LDDQHKQSSRDWPKSGQPVSSFRWRPKLFSRRSDIDYGRAAGVAGLRCNRLARKKGTFERLFGEISISTLKEC
jgi:hypothetical protein